MNYDKDGDQIFHDLLDALTKWQPGSDIYNVNRNNIHPLAKRLHSKSTERVDNLVLYRQTSVPVIELMLSNMWKGISIMDSNIKTTANRLFGAFTNDEANIDGMTWQTFENVLTVQMVHPPLRLS